MGVLVISTPMRQKKFEYPINRFTMEVKRQLDVLDKNLEDRIPMWRVTFIRLQIWHCGLGSEV